MGTAVAARTPGLIASPERWTLTEEQTYAESLEDWALLCRNLRHAWPLVLKREHFSRTPTGNSILNVTCERCGTERVTVTDRLTGKRYNRYYYPEGYQRSGGGTLTKEANAIFWKVMLKALGSK